MAADNAEPKTPRETADSDSDSDGARHRAAAVHALDVYEGDFGLCTMVTSKGNG